MRVYRVLFSLSFSVASVMSVAQAVDVTVNCDNPGVGDFNSISDALTAHDATGGELVIDVDGICAENVVIERGRVKLRGGTVNGGGGNAITVLGANQVVIEGMTLDGDRGVRVEQQGAVSIENSTINPPINSTILVSRFGVQVVGQGFASVKSSDIHGERAAVFVADASLAEIEDCTLTSTSNTPGSATLLVIRAFAHLRRNNEVEATDGMAMNFVAAVIRQDRGHTTVVGPVEMVLSPVALFDIDITAEPAVLVGGNSDLVLRNQRGRTILRGDTVIGDRSSLFIVDDPLEEKITLEGDLECVLYVQDESEPATPGYTRGVVTNRQRVNVTGRVIGCQGGG